MKNNIKQYIYFFAFFIKLLIVLCQEIPIIAQINLYLNCFVLLLLFIVFILQIKEYKLKEILVLSLFIIVFGISAYCSRDTTLLQLLLFMMLYKDINHSKFFTYSIISKIIILMFVICLWRFGVINEIVTKRAGSMIRHSWGLPHPNILGLVLFSICCEIFCLHYKKIKKSDILFLIVALLISVIICNSRSAQIGIIILLICALVLPKIENNSFFKKSIVHLPIVLFAVSLVLMLIYPMNYSWIQKINEFLSGRIFYASNFYKYYGISFFGNLFVRYGDPHGAPWFFALDCGYMFLLIKFGILATTLFMYLLIKAIKYSIKTKKYFILIYLIPFLFYGLMENYIIYFQFNTILIYCGSLIFTYNKD